jgi:hypothetical protein
MRWSAAERAVKKDRVTEAVNIPAFYAALEDPYEDRANGEDRQCQPERNEEACGKRQRLYNSAPGSRKSCSEAD